MLSSITIYEATSICIDKGANLGGLSGGCLLDLTDLTAVPGSGAAQKQSGTGGNCTANHRQHPIDNKWAYN